MKHQDVYQQDISQEGAGDVISCSAVGSGKNRFTSYYSQCHEFVVFPVSYTHLDVYKRQELTPRLLRQIDRLSLIHI